MNRRDFLKNAGIVGASAALFPSWMPKLAFAPPKQDTAGDVLICIFLRGGMDGLSSVAPYGDGSHYYNARPTQAIAEPGKGANALLDLDGYFGLHPALAPLRDFYLDGDLAMVHASGLTDSTRSHFDAMTYMEFGTPGSKTTGTGWIARHLESAAWQNDSPFRAIGMGTILPQSLRGPVSSLALKSIADFHFKGRPDEMQRQLALLSNMYGAVGDPLSSQADLVFNTVDMMQAIHRSGYAPANGASYAEDEFGMGLQQIAQLVKADVGLEVACLDLGGWDTHDYQGTLDGTFNELLTSLARGLEALYVDLGDRMRNVTVITMSEFGRTIDENASAGTDHGHGNVMFLMGGGVNGGKVYGDWPTLAPDARADGDLAITTDYRHVLAEAITKRLGNQAIDRIFPGFDARSLGVFG